MTSGSTSAEPWRQWPLGMVATVVGNHSSSVLNTLRPETLVSAVTRLVIVTTGFLEHNHITHSNWFTFIVNTGQNIPLKILCRQQVSIIKLDTELSGVDRVGVILVVDN